MFTSLITAGKFDARSDYRGCRVSDSVSTLGERFFCGLEKLGYIIRDKLSRGREQLLYLELGVVVLVIQQMDDSC